MGRLSDKLEVILINEKCDVEDLMDKYGDKDCVPGVCLRLGCDAVDLVKPGSFENKCPVCGNYTVIAYNVIIDN